MSLLDGAAAPAADEFVGAPSDRCPAPHSELGGSIAVRPNTAPRNRIPAASAQRRLWVLDHIIPNPEVYVNRFLVRLDGAVDADGLRRAFERLEARHEALRVHFEAEDGLPVQVVGDIRPFEWKVRDLRALPVEEARASALHEATAEASQRIALDAVRLWQATLYQASDTECHLALSVHQAIADEASLRILWRDLGAYCESARTGSAVALPALTVPYADFALRDQQRRTSSAYPAQLAYWKKQLAGPMPTLDLPMSRPRPKWQGYKGNRVGFAIPTPLIAAIDRVCGERGVSRNLLALTAFQTVLYRYTAQDTLTLGIPVANRTAEEAESMIGLFANTVVLRTTVAGDLSFAAMLDRVRQTWADAVANPDVSLEALIEELRPARDPSRPPLFQATFEYQNAPVVPERFAGLAATPISVPTGTAMYDLRLGLEDSPAGELRGWVEFNTDLLDESQVTRLVGHFLSVLDAATADPATPIDALPLLPPDEHRRIVFEWNQTAGAYPDADCIQDAFARQAAATPAAPAILAGVKTITYRQLHEKANRLAHFLLARGVKQGDMVGVCLKRSADMVAAVLAVTRIGAAYVPLDPAYPKDRLAFMLEDTKAPVVLTQWALLDRFPSPDRLVNIEQADAEIAKLPATDLPRTHTPDAIAYVIYTSGSTGRPKGVVVRHRAAVNTIDWVTREFGVGPKDKLLFVTSLSFDLSVFDVFGVLGAGGCLRIADETELKDPAMLAEVLRTEGITMWDSAPAALQQLVPFFGHGKPTDSLRLVMLSGDWIPVSLPDQVRTAFPNAKVLSLGGATEAAIWSNWFPIGVVDPAWPSIPYGKPIRNAWYHVLDAKLQPLPVGVPGELHIGGTCLADGYLNRAELTAERFIPDPFRSGERLYKTGDLARYMPDGNIEFLGRIDHQVKVRGYRVELGEIETALAQHPAVREAVVKPFRDDTGMINLAAYVVRKAPVESPDLAKHLRAGLPEYMVPTAFIYLDAIPLTANGKVDRNALPAPDTQAKAAATAYDAPNNDAERALQGLLEEVLNIRPVSATARFDELGVHSLMAAQLVSRIETRLGHKVPLETLFRAPTVRELAGVIQQKLEAGTGSLVPLNTEGFHAPMILIAGAGGHVFTFHKFSRLLGSEFPAFGMKAIGVDGSEPPLDRVEQIAERYLEEILKVRPRGPYVLGGYSVGGLMAFEVALMMQKRGLEVARVISFDTHAPGYPRKLPLPVRMGIHLLNFLTRPGERKWTYLRDRFRNVRHKLLTMVGMNHLDLEAPPNVVGLSEQTLRKVWAALERARNHYWPSAKFDGQLVLVRPDQPEHWAATRLDDPVKGWGRWTTQPVQTIGVPVGHMEIFSDENLDLLVKQVREVLRSTRRRTRPGSRESLVLP